MDSVELIRELCKDRKISIAKLERDCGFSNGYIRGLRRGVLPNDRAKIIADYLGVSLDYLTTGIEYIPNTGLKDRIKTLAQKEGMSLPALEEELGFGNGTIVKWDKSTPNAEKLNAVAKYFGVSMDYLLNGESEASLTSRDERDIKEILSNTEELLKQDGLMFDGDPASPEAVESILSAMQIGMEMAKKKNKEKYTPKKYKKD